MFSHEIFAEYRNDPSNGPRRVFPRRFRGAVPLGGFPFLAAEGHSSGVTVMCRSGVHQSVRASIESLRPEALILSCDGVKVSATYSSVATSYKRERASRTHQYVLARIDESIQSQTRAKPVALSPSSACSGVDSMTSDKTERIDNELIHNPMQTIYLVQRAIKRRVGEL